MDGLEAVKAQITCQFSITEKDIEEHLDFDTKDVTLRFGAGDREHDVRVSREFKDDYADIKQALTSHASKSYCIRTAQSTSQGVA